MGVLPFPPHSGFMREMEEGKLRNSKNKKLFCLLLTAAMLAQPAAGNEDMMRKIQLQSLYYFRGYYCMIVWFFSAGFADVSQLIKYSV